MLPVLRLTGDGAQHPMAEMRERIAHELHLTSDELAEKLESGNRLFANRLAWAGVYLKKAELLSPCGRGAYRITERGKTLLDGKPAKITLKTLLLGSPKGAQASEHGATPIRLPELASTPEEQFEHSFAVLRDTLAHEILDLLTKTSPPAFERIVVDLLIAMGYGGALEDAEEVVGKSGDGGIDGTIKQDKLGLDMVYVTCKQSVGRKASAALK